MSASIKPVSFASSFGHNVATGLLPKGFLSWTIPVYNYVSTHSDRWLYLRRPISGSVVSGFIDSDTPLEHDVTMIFPAANGGTRDRSFTLGTTDRKTGLPDSGKIPVDEILAGEAELVVGSLGAEFAEPADSDPLRDVVVWTVPVSAFLSSGSNADQYFVSLDGPADAIRSDGGDATTPVSEDVSFIFPRENLDAKGKPRKRGRTIDVRIVSRATGKLSRVEIPLDK